MLCSFVVVFFAFPFIRLQSTRISHTNYYRISASSASIFCFYTPTVTKFTFATMASAELPKKYKAIVYDKPGSISTKIEELDMPEPGPGEVLINL
jgi:hypothetical protein